CIIVLAEDGIQHFHVTGVHTCALPIYQGSLQLVTKEHMHDLGKFMFAFSIFWTYLWFAQFMLIWYSNIPEETAYFKMRAQGPYRSVERRVGRESRSRWSSGVN